MYPLCSEHSPGTDSPALMSEEDVNRGPLKNDFHANAGLHWEETHLSEKQDGPP